MGKFVLVRNSDDEILSTGTNFMAQEGCRCVNLEETGFTGDSLNSDVTKVAGTLTTAKVFTDSSSAAKLARSVDFQAAFADYLTNGNKASLDAPLQRKISSKAQDKLSDAEWTALQVVYG